MKSKLLFKLVVIFLLIAIATITIVGLMINWSLNNKFANYVQEVERKQNLRIVNSLASLYQQQNSWQNIRHNLMRLEMMTGRRVQITKEGEKVFDSRMCAPQHMRRGMMTNRVKKQEGRTIKLPIKVNSQVVGYANITPLNRKGLWSEEDIDFRATINSSIITAGIITSLIVLLASFIISKRITSPLRQMSAIAQAMEQGDLNKRIKIDSQDEIGTLADNLNSLASHLQNLEQLRQNMTADIAHELRTPLTTIRSHIEAIEDGIIEPNQKNLESINEEIIRLVKLVEDLQELSTTEAGQQDFEFEKIDLAQLIRNSVNNIAAAFSDKEIDLQLDLTEINFISDQEAVTKIINNLVSNAYKYTSDQGEISIVTRLEDDKVLIKVKDNGIGIPKKELPYICERFYRVDTSRTRRTGGTGVGLAIVDELVKSLEGKLTINSELGAGTEVMICLPTNLSD
ncbi:MAG: sensor histidine kinase [Bacillota bacterium]